MDFINALVEYPFLQRAVVIALFSSIAFGLTGPYVVKNRLSFVAGGIAHAVMGGIGAAYFLQFNTTLGAIISAILFSLILTITKKSSTGREDTIVGTLWAIGMSAGIIFIYITPGYSADLMSFIFGNILMVDKTDILIILILDGVLLLLVVLFYQHFLFLSFDEDFLSVRGLRVQLIYFLMLSMISITVVVTIKTVGLILVIALITLPTVTAELFTKKMGTLFFAAISLGVVFTTSGIFFAYTLDIPASACTILLSGGIYFIALIIKSIATQRA